MVVQWEVQLLGVFYPQRAEIKTENFLHPIPQRKKQQAERNENTLCLMLVISIKEGSCCGSNPL